jgi:hypothetical protein
MCCRVDLVMTLVMINLDHVLGINLCQMLWESCSLTVIMFSCAYRELWKFTYTSASCENS